MDAARADAFFAGEPVGLATLARVRDALLPIAGVTERVTRSQVALRRRRGFAWLWVPGRALRRPAAPVVLSIALGREDASPRWKEIAHPSSRHWIHHLEIRDAAEVDEEVTVWLPEAAGRA